MTLVKEIYGIIDHEFRGPLRQYADIIGTVIDASHGCINIQYS